QIPGGRAWFGAGRILYADPEQPDTERARLASLEFRIAPFLPGTWKHFTTLDGLPGNEVRKILANPDGSLWIGTVGGLAHFDGDEFRVFTKSDGLLDNSILNLHRETNGLLWVCSAKGVSRFDPDALRAGRKEFTNFTAENGLI